jgi:hypothetical protein
VGYDIQQAVEMQYLVRLRKEGRTIKEWPALAFRLGEPCEGSITNTTGRAAHPPGRKPCGLEAVAAPFKPAGPVRLG